MKIFSFLDRICMYKTDQMTDLSRPETKTGPQFKFSKILLSRSGQFLGKIFLLYLCISFLWTSYKQNFIVAFCIFMFISSDFVVVVADAALYLAG